MLTLSPNMQYNLACCEELFTPGPGEFTNVMAISPHDYGTSTMSPTFLQHPLFNDFCEESRGVTGGEECHELSNAYNQCAPTDRVTQDCSRTIDASIASSHVKSYPCGAHRKGNPAGETKTKTKTKNKTKAKTKTKTKKRRVKGASVLSTPTKENDGVPAATKRGRATVGATRGGSLLLRKFGEEHNMGQANNSETNIVIMGTLATDENIIESKDVSKESKRDSRKRKASQSCEKEKKTKVKRSRRDRKRKDAAKVFNASDRSGRKKIKTCSEFMIDQGMLDRVSGPYDAFLGDMYWDDVSVDSLNADADGRRVGDNPPIHHCMLMKYSTLLQVRPTHDKGPDAFAFEVGNVDDLLRIPSEDAFAMQVWSLITDLHELINDPKYHNAHMLGCLRLLPGGTQNSFEKFVRPANEMEACALGSNSHVMQIEDRTMVVGRELHTIPVIFGNRKSAIGCRVPNDLRSTCSMLGTAHSQSLVSEHEKYANSLTRSSKKTDELAQRAYDELIEFEKTRPVPEVHVIPCYCERTDNNRNDATPSLHITADVMMSGGDEPEAIEFPTGTGYEWRGMTDHKIVLTDQEVRALLHGYYPYTGVTKKTRASNSLEFRRRFYRFCKEVALRAEHLPADCERYTVCKFTMVIHAFDASETVSFPEMKLDSNLFVFANTDAK